MSERRLIDATALCRYLSNWQLRCAGNVTGGKDARDNLVIYNTLGQDGTFYDNKYTEDGQT